MRASRDMLSPVVIIAKKQMKDMPDSDPNHIHLDCYSLPSERLWKLDSLANMDQDRLPDVCLSSVLDQ